MLSGRHPCTAIVIVGTALVLAFAARASAQRLTVHGDRFLVDGTPRFLTFISYFGAMGAHDVGADLQFLRDAGFDGVRIWPNLNTGPQLMRADGGLDAAGLARLRFVLDRARERRLIVDVTFTAEHINGLTAGQYGAAIAQAATVLKPYENVLIDIENERNLYGPFGRPLTAADVADIAAGIRRADPARIVTASNSGMPPGDAARFTADTGLDVTAYHEPRTPRWHERGEIDATVQALRTNGRPAYLQEPNRFPYPSTDRADYFRAARANARRAGAAAWCFHTDLGFDLRGDGVTFKGLLRSRAEPDWAFVTSLVTAVPARPIPNP